MKFENGLFGVRVVARKRQRVLTCVVVEKQAYIEKEPAKLMIDLCCAVDAKAGGARGRACRPIFHEAHQDFSKTIVADFRVSIERHTVLAFSDFSLAGEPSLVGHAMS